MSSLTFVQKNIKIGTNERGGIDLRGLPPQQFSI